MNGFRIRGSGAHAPGRPYTNHDLARVMDTTDEWVRQRTGIEQRHYCPADLGVADLAYEAAREALAQAGCVASDIDYIVFNTMAPDLAFPGSGSLLGARLGCFGAPALDIRQQCAASLFSFQIADGLFRSGAAKRVLLVAAENHASFMPWRRWDILDGLAEGPDPADYARATEHRGWAVIFGDGAAALVLEPSDEAGLLSTDLHTDGRYVDQLKLPAGFRGRPWITPERAATDAVLPTMSGREVFKHAITKLPESIRVACASAGVSLDEIDWFVAHQANDRINEAIRERMGVPKQKFPSNIARWGNTSTATVPILLHEMRARGELRPGQLVCIVALGAGLHWGSAVLRV